MLRAPPHRRLVYAGGEAARRHRRQRAGVARPSDVEIFARGRRAAEDIDVAPHAVERPIKRAREPGRAVFLARERGAAPLIGPVKQPDARMAERRGDLRDLGYVGRARPAEPAARGLVQRRHERRRRTRQGSEAIVPQGAGAKAAQLGMPQRAADADVYDGNRRQAAARGARIARRHRNFPGCFRLQGAAAPFTKTNIPSP